MEQTYAELTKDCKDCQNWLASGSRSGIRTTDLSHALSELEWFQRHSSTHKPSTGRKGNGKPQGAFAFTLTKSPNDDLSVSDMIAAVRKVMSQKSNKVKRYAWYFEQKGQDANGLPLHPHIHGMYETETGGRIIARHWKRAWDIWDETKEMGQGFRGGYHRPVMLEENYSDYIAKDGGLSENKNIMPEYNDATQTLPDRTRIDSWPLAGQDRSQEEADGRCQGQDQLCEAGASGGES